MSIDMHTHIIPPDWAKRHGAVGCKIEVVGAGKATSFATYFAFVSLLIAS